MFPILAFDFWRASTTVVALAASGMAAWATIKSSSKSATATKESEEAARVWAAVQAQAARELEERQMEYERRVAAEKRLHEAEDRAEARVRAAEERVERLQAAFEIEAHRFGAELADARNELRECKENARTINADLMLIRSTLREQILDAAVEVAGVPRHEIETMLTDEGNSDG